MNELIIILLLAIMAEVYFLSRPKKASVKEGEFSMLVDTSVLMDGRVIELAKTGFLMGRVTVPRSVLSELQLLADGADHAKRERARFGMDIMKELKDIMGANFLLITDSQYIPEGVDGRLLKLAKQLNSAVLTLDYNLNKVAQVEGVQVLNINELAKSLRMVNLPGDAVDLALTQKGQDKNQAVGYLPDGTMVVVDQAKKFINQTKKVEIIRSLQTDAGRMMFAKIVEPVQKTKPSGSAKATSPKTSIRAEAKPAPAKSSSTNSRQDTGTNKSLSAKKTHVRTRKTTARPKTLAQREDDLIRLAKESK